MNSAENFPDTTDDLHRLACKAKRNFYIDSATGYKVMTEYYLLKRGYCCSSGCKHCPYELKGHYED